MRIEVIAESDMSTTEKGNLLETIAADLLRVQGFSVTQQIRITASELDMLCTHNVSGKIVYVECKAHRDPLSANALTNLLGNVNFHEYSEGWLITAGPLGKDAKGFMVEWEKKSREKRNVLCIYHPDRVVDALIDANLIEAPPKKAVDSLIGEAKTGGEWTLLITKWGKFWACPTLSQGIPDGVLIFNATTSENVDDDELLSKLKSTDTSLRELSFWCPTKPPRIEAVTTKEKTCAVVEVEFGEQWTDYRPARPEHFVGRGKAIRSLLRFFSVVKKQRTDSRVFAIKGDSGIGKSSLVAKLRAVAKISKKPSNIFLYAVDVRASNSSSYVHASCLAALLGAAQNGFGLDTTLEISNYADPLQSESIKQFLAECERKHELVILVFDQFEELYSKPELFSIFDEVRKLMFSALAASTNFVLGFAWKTDSTVPQDHPAYHMWHELSDHRYEILLTPFSHADAEQSIRIFEKELGERLRPELRRYLIENSQGYPWLLKKLCIHLYEQIRSGVTQMQLADRSLDIALLFDRDLSNLTTSQTACIKLVAEHAPIDWYEVLDTAGAEVVQTLQNRRLLIRRGDKLNLYWDIFRDYVLAGTIPSIPFTYIPQAPSISTLLRVALELNSSEPKTLTTLADGTGLSESTVRNIVHDLEQFGIADVNGDNALLDSDLQELDSQSVLSRIRVVFKRHALTTLLRENYSAKAADQEQIVHLLKRLNPTAQHHSRTWNTYANRMCIWLSTLGYLERRNRGYAYFDKGDINREDTQQFRGERRRVVFIGDAPPSRAIEALEKIQKSGPLSVLKMKSLGYRNSCAVLFRFRLIELNPAHEYQVSKLGTADHPALECVWDEMQKEDSILFAAEYIEKKPWASAADIGRYINDRFARNWTETTCVRIGNSLRQWAAWLLSNRGGGNRIPEPPRKRSASANQQNETLDLFGQVND